MQSAGERTVRQPHAGNNVVPELLSLRRGTLAPCHRVGKKLPGDNVVPELLSLRRGTLAPCYPGCVNRQLASLLVSRTD